MNKAAAIFSLIALGFSIVVLLVSLVWMVKALRSIRDIPQKPNAQQLVSGRPRCPKCGKPYINRRVPKNLRGWDEGRRCWNWLIPSCECNAPL